MEEKLTYRRLKELVLEVLKETNSTGAVGGYNSPKAFGKNSNKPFSQKVSRPKRPSHTKLFDFLEEEHEQA